MDTKVLELLQKTRSVRRFDPDLVLQDREIEELINVTRFCPSGANRQPLRYFYVNTKAEVAFVMQNLHFAALIKDWVPAPEEYPSACILILLDRRISASAAYDSGIAAQAILMAAAERGLGGCMLGSVDRQELYAHYGLDPECCSIDLAVVIGKPAEQVVLTDTADGKTAYWRGEDNVHYVPKRPLKDILAGRA